MFRNNKLSSYKNKKEIDQLLNPVLSTIRKNKIYSFIQLKNANRPLQQRSFIFQPLQNNQSKTLQLNSKTLNQKFFPSRYRNQQQKCSKTAQNKQTTNPQDSNNFITYLHDKNRSKIQKQKEQKRLQKMLKNKTFLKSSQSPTLESSKKVLRTSKIMRHLVQGVDFDQMQKNLYKKRQCITRYDYFMMQKNSRVFQNPKNKSKSFSYHKNIQTLKNSIVLSPTINKSQTVQTRIPPKLVERHMIEQCRNQTFRTPRKKFWQKQFNQLRSSSKLNKTTQKIRHIQGKSFRKLGF